MTNKMFNHEMLQGFLAQLYQEATGYLRYSPEEVKKILTEIISGSSIDDFRGFQFGETPAAAEDLELEELI